MQGGRREERLPRGAVLRPVVMLVAGLVAGVALWRFLMLEPDRSAGLRVPVAERLSQGDRAALGRLLHDRPRP